MADFKAWSHSVRKANWPFDSSRIMFNASSPQGQFVPAKLKTNFGNVLLIIAKRIFTSSFSQNNHIAIGHFRENLTRNYRLYLHSFFIHYT